MVGYALLVAASSNRVYAQAAYGLGMAELEMFSTVLSTPLRGVTEATLGGVRYLTFHTDAALTGSDLAYLSLVSSRYALFERVGEDLLRPLPVPAAGGYDDDLITIPKYAGKTNEQFTQLLLNATVLASASAPRMRESRLTVLDPLCGRGTTLNQALMYGYDAIGIERDGKDVDAYSAFLRTWLRHKRLKHHADLSPVRRDRRLVARRFEARIGEGADAQHVTMFHADTTAAREFLRAACADVIVTDAPYGVAHGSHGAGGLSRAPLELLRAALPVWVQLLRPGGTVGLSFNTHVAPRADTAGVLADAGLIVVTGRGYDDLAHRVDQGIHRDVLVARRPG